MSLPSLSRCWALSLCGLALLTHLSAAPALLAQDAGNLLKNGDFAAADADGKPADWKLDNAQPTAVDTSDKPDGAPASLRVEITEDKGKNLGEIGQEVKVGPEEVYRLTAQVKSSHQKAGVLQIKLRIGKKEGERISVSVPDGDWSEISKDFSTQDSDNILVLCRYSQKPELVGATVHFANLKLVKLEGEEAAAALEKAASAAEKAKKEKEDQAAKDNAANAKLAVAEKPSHEAPVAVPTFHAVGLYWQPAAGAKDNACAVSYRAAGETEWKEALPLWFDATTHKGLPMRSKEYRGSIVNLQPATEYEVKLALAKGGAVAELKFKTLDENFKIARTVTITAEQAKTQPLVITEGGSPESGYVEYRLADGVVLDGQGTAEANLQVNASWVMLKGITAKNADKHGIVLGEVTDIVIDGCDISGWGRVEKELEGFGQNMNSAVYGKNSTLARVVIQNCKMHHPRSNANSWEETHTKDGKKGGPATKHPMGPQCISIFRSRGQLVIRNNEFFSDPAHKYNDVMGEYHNFSFDGFPVRDSDIYNNRVSNAYDDGIELEGANLNVRAWGNHFDDVYGAIGCATTSLGPIYLYRNVMHTSRKGPVSMNSFQGNRGSYFLKLGTEKKEWTYGKIYVFHNTTLQPAAPAGMSDFKTTGAMAGLVKTGDTKNQSNITSRNNIIFLRDHKDPAKKWNAFNDPHKDPTNDFDYDLYNGSLKAKDGAQANGIVGKPTFDTTQEGTAALAQGSLGIDAGERLPNFNDGFKGAAPDMGAVESLYTKSDQAAVTP